MYSTSAMSVLSRSTALSSTTLTPLQVQVDGLTSTFLAQATDWRSLAAMTAGGGAYRLGRVGLLSSGGGNISRVVSFATGLGAEVTTFEITHRGLDSLSPRGPRSVDLWRWSGRGGLAQGLLQSSLTFGTLRGAGRIVQGENFLLQHVLQDGAMVASHNVAGRLGLAPLPTGSMAEQFLHAEATLWQMQAGMSLAHGMAPRLAALERGLDLSLPAGEGRDGYDPAGREAYAWAGPSRAGSRAPRLPEGPVGPSVAWMSGRPKGSGGEGSEPAKASASGSGERPRAAQGPELESFWVDESARAAAEASTEGYITINERGLILYANPALHELLGYEQQGLVGRPLTLLIPPSFRTRHEAGLRRYLTTGVRNFDHRKGVDFPALHNNGSWVNVTISLQESVRGRDRFFIGTLSRVATRPEGSVERTPLPSLPKPHERSGRFVIEGERPGGTAGTAPKGRSAAETSQIGLRVDRLVGEKGASSMADLARLQKDLAGAATDFRTKVETEGDIEIRLSTTLSREFLEANREEIVSGFHNRVWGHMVRTGRKVALIFQTSGGPCKIDLVKADVGYRLAE